MDGLSTSAREWTPAGFAQSTQQRQQQQPSSNQEGGWQAESDLTAATVKEFVPGLGWKAGITSSSQAAGKFAVFCFDAREKETFLMMDILQVNHLNLLIAFLMYIHMLDSELQDVNRNPYAAAATAIHGYPSENTPTDSEPDGAEETGFPSTVAAGPTTPPFRCLRSLGMADDLWRQHRQWQLEGIRQLEPTDPRYKAIPAPYCNPWPLDYDQSARSSSFGYPCATFQVASQTDGYLYCLRRFDGVKSVNSKIASTVAEQWVGFEHPNLVALHRVFVAQRALFFVHSYIPGVVPLRDRLVGSPVSEPVLWSAICQWTGLIRRIHQARMAVLTLDARHVLLQIDSLRVRWYINCIGVPDTLEWESRKSVESLQAEDIRKLGRLILSLATGTEITISSDPNTIARCERFCLQTYSRELHNLTMTLLRSRTPPSIVDICRALTSRVWDEMDLLGLSLRGTEQSLGAEFESGRILRIMLKLGFINERPEFGPNRRWAQSGDCYILTLFRDYVFHQADGGGNPVMDMGHVLMTLNKLDAADEEKIVLTSRDGKSMMVVSFADVARCLESAYHELCSGAARPQVPQQPY